MQDSKGNPSVMCNLVLFADGRISLTVNPVGTDGQPRALTPRELTFAAFHWAMNHEPVLVSAMVNAFEHALKNGEQIGFTATAIVPPDEPGSRMN